MQANQSGGLIISLCSFLIKCLVMKRDAAPLTVKFTLSKLTDFIVYIFDFSFILLSMMSISSPSIVAYAEINSIQSY